MTLSLDSSQYTSLQVVEIKKIEQQMSDVQNAVDEISTVQPGDFLSITSRQPSVSGNSWILAAMGYDDVISGAVEDEIQSVISETDAIASAMDDVKPQTNYAKVPTTTVRNYGSSDTFECSTNTSSQAVTDAVNRGDYNKTYASGKTAQQYKDAVVKAFEGVIAFLDDLIANYDTRVASGLASGHQEVKLTALLQLSLFPAVALFPRQTAPGSVPNQGLHSRPRNRLCCLSPLSGSRNKSSCPARKGTDSPRYALHNSPARCGGSGLHTAHPAAWSPGGTPRNGLPLRLPPPGSPHDPPDAAPHGQPGNAR